jgi:hypothetical protein
MAAKIRIYANLSALDLAIRVRIVRENNPRPADGAVKELLAQIGSK